MSTTQEHDLTLLRAVEGLDPDQRDEFVRFLEAHAPRSAASLLEMEAALAAVALALPRAAASPQVRQALLDRVSRDAVGAAPAVSRESLRGRGPNGLWRIAAAAGIGLAIGMAGWHWGVSAPKLRQMEQVARTAQDEAGRAGRMMGSPEVQLIAFKGSSTQPEAGGRVFWDRQNKRWSVYVFNLKPPEKGRAYELWFINDQQKPMPAGMIQVDAQGSGSMTVAVPDSAGRIVLAAVSDELAGGSPTGLPQGKIHLTGQAEQP